MKSIFVFILSLFIFGVFSQQDDQVLLNFRASNLNVLTGSSFSGWNDTSNTSPCTWFGVVCFNGRVTGLFLNNARLTVLPELANLTQINVLDLSQNNFGGSIPSSVGLLASERLSFLRLNLSSNAFTGPLPSTLANLTKLRFLDLSKNQLTGPLPDLGQMVGLWYMDLSYNNFGSPLPSTIGNLPSLTTLYLQNANLVGPLPSSFSRLAQIQVLDISFNGFTGTIPSLDFWVQIQSFIANNNQFTGQVPRLFRSYTGPLNISSNNFRCPIPSCNLGFSCSLPSQNLPCTCECVPNGACVYGVTTCVCSSNYFGETCQSQCPGVTTVNNIQLPCSGNGVCSEGWNGTGLCTCNTGLGYGSADCSRRCPANIINGTLILCSNKGSCVDGLCQCFDNFGGPSCSETCINNWAGVAQNCRLECRGGRENPCNKNGECNPIDGSCKCKSGYYGEACQSKRPVGLIVGLTILAVILLVGASVAAFFWWRRYNVEEEQEKFIDARTRRKEQIRRYQEELAHKQEGTLSMESEYIATQDLFKQYFDPSLLPRPKSAPQKGSDKQENIEMDELKTSKTTQENLQEDE